MYLSLRVKPGTCQSNSRFAPAYISKTRPHHYNRRQCSPVRLERVCLQCCIGANRQIRLPRARDDKVRGLSTPAFVVDFRQKIRYDGFEVRFKIEEACFKRVGLCVLGVGCHGRDFAGPADNAFCHPGRHVFFQKQPASIQPACRHKVFRAIHTTLSHKARHFMAA